MLPLARVFALGLLLVLSSAQSAPQSPPDRTPAPAAAPETAPEPEREALQAARDLAAQAKAAREKSDLDEARAKALEAVDLLVALAPGSLSPAEDQLLADLGSFSHRLGDLETSRRARERVVLEREGCSPRDEALLAQAWGNLAITLATQGELEAARALFERVLQTLERAEPQDNLQLARANQNLAMTVGALGDPVAARALLERAIEIFERTLPAGHPELMRVQGNLATTLLALGDVTAARALAERVLEVFERTLPPDDPDLTSMRQNLAIALKTQGDLSAARVLEERVLEARERTLPADHLEIAWARQNLGITLFTQGDLPAARALQERAVEVCERTLPADSPDLAAARGNLSNTLRFLGDLPAARALQERALEVAERTMSADHFDLAAARLNLADTLRTLGELPAAHALEERALEVYERTLPPDHPELAAARLDLAATLRSQGDLLAARALFERVVDVRERTLPPDHPDLSAARADLAQTLGALWKEGDEANRLALERLSLDFVRGLRRMTQAALLDGSPREVEERLASRETELAYATSLARGYGRIDLGPELTSEVFLLGESTRAGGPIAARLAARAADDPIGSDLRARIAAATEELARLAQSGGSADDLGRARAAVDLAGRNLARHASRLLGSDAPLEPTLASLARELGATGAFVAWRRTMQSRVQPGDPPAWTHDDDLIAFVLRPPVPSKEGGSAAQGPRLELVDLGPIAPIEAAIERWRSLLGVSTERGLAAKDASADLADAGRDVRALVLDPLRGALQGVDRAVVALDDALHAIPLDALPAGEVWGTAAAPAPLLGDVLNIEVRSSLIETLSEQAPLTGRATLLAIGHPAFDANPSSANELEEESRTVLASVSRSGAESGLLRGGAWERGFGTLPETRIEVRGIAQYFEDAFGEDGTSIVLERRKASRETLVEFAPKARWLHVATHGWNAPESVRSSADPSGASRGTVAGLPLDEGARLRGMSPMLLCGLALAGANLPVNAVGRIPGLLTAQELSTLDLSNCELAVLSACDTNVGHRRAGQGVASLQKALNMAGARSVITSLWKVPDEATKDLMIDFYRRVWIEKKPKHQALWEAKMKLRNAQDERGQPRYTTRDWAAWVLTGNPE